MTEAGGNTPEDLQGTVFSVAKVLNVREQKSINGYCSTV
ncbi:hypothetical protein J3R74_000061 [Puniceicoccus vermicola]